MKDAGQDFDELFLQVWILVSSHTVVFDGQSDLREKPGPELPRGTVLFPGSVESVQIGLRFCFRERFYDEFQNPPEADPGTRYRDGVPVFRVRQIVLHPTDEVRLSGPGVPQDCGPEREACLGRENH